MFLVFHPVLTAVSLHFPEVSKCCTVRKILSDIRTEINIKLTFKNLRTPSSKDSVTRFFKTPFVPRVYEGPLSFQGFYFMYRYNIWQDSVIRTRVAATAIGVTVNYADTVTA